MISPKMYEALLPYRPGPKKVDASGLSQREVDLLNQKLIEAHEFTSGSMPGVFSIAASSYHITSNGEDALAEFEKAQQRETDQKRQHDEEIAQANENRKKEFRHDWLIAIFSAVISFVLGLIVEYFFDIIAFLFGPHH